MRKKNDFWLYSKYNIFNYICPLFEWVFITYFSFVSLCSIFFPIHTQTQGIVRLHDACAYFGSFYSRYGILLALLRMTDARIDVSRVRFCLRSRGFQLLCYFRHMHEWEIRGIATPCAAGTPPMWLQIVQVSSTTNQVLWTARLSRNPDVCVHAWSSSDAFLMLLPYWSSSDTINNT